MSTLRNKEGDTEKNIYVDISIADIRSAARIKDRGEQCNIEKKHRSGKQGI